MKKLLISFLLLAMSTATLTGCNGSYNAGGGNPDTAIDFQASLGGSNENVDAGNKTEDRGEDGKNNEDKSQTQKVEITASLDWEELNKYNAIGLLTKEERKEYAKKLLETIIAMGDGKAWAEYYGVTNVTEGEKSAQYGNYGTAFYRVGITNDENVPYVQEEWSVDKSECYYRRFYAEDSTGVFKIIYVMGSEIESEYYIVAVHGVNDEGTVVRTNYMFNKQGVPLTAGILEIGDDNKVSGSENFNWK